ncbi:MAG: N-acetyltransferase family protein [Phycisphaerales bacterium]
MSRRHFTIRDATDEDLPAIFAIYNRHALHGIATFDTVPRTLDTHRDFLSKRDLARHPVLIAVDDDGETLGYASLSSWSDKCAYARAAEFSVYVRDDAHGKGVGRALAEAVFARAPKGGVFVALSRIAIGPETEPSVRLHEKLGFERVGVQRRVGEKFGRILDVLLMEKHLD